MFSTGVTPVLACLSVETGWNDDSNSPKCGLPANTRRSYAVADAVHLVDEKSAERRHESDTLCVVVDDLVVGVQKTLCSSPCSTGSPATSSS